MPVLCIDYLMKSSQHSQEAGTVIIMPVLHMGKQMQEVLQLGIAELGFKAGLPRSRPPQESLSSSVS